MLLLKTQLTSRNADRFVIIGDGWHRAKPVKGAILSLLNPQIIRPSLKSRLVQSPREGEGN